MTIEIKLTCETVAEAQAEMAALLEGRPRVSISGSGLKDMLPRAADTPPTAVQTSPVQSVAASASSESSPANTPTGSTETPLVASSESTTEQPKRGRGRPRKDALPPSTAPASSGTPDVTDSAAEAETEVAATADAGNAPSGEASATAPAEPTSDAASSTSSESAPQDLAAEQANAPADTGNAVQPAAEAPVSVAEASPPAGEQPLVTDADLQRFCAKVAEKFGGPTKLFDACKPYLAEGEVPRPTNIKDNGDRWLFIRQMEVESGLTYHG